MRSLGIPALQGGEVQRFRILGQQQVFPAFLRRTNVLFVPAVLPLIWMIFWLIRVRFTNAYKRKSLPSSGHVYSLRT